jgi:hypothetical protein
VSFGSLPGATDDLARSRGGKRDTIMEQFIRIEKKIYAFWKFGIGIMGPD